ncbi:hypothetical protein [Dyella caseinilytica]|uniref:Uncharacterized protein n=1 Tax=Dyella caseinilytica TaxID=1849581 RepID=A0ABX7GXM2_9GAMM|nr:hypothetical protein [Dyella caseinilytica]QRN55226.1 hypothetical protein ISN74_07820 [Dyella caseinilytica]
MTVDGFDRHETAPYDTLGQGAIRIFAIGFCDPTDMLPCVLALNWLAYAGKLCGHAWFSRASGVLASGETLRCSVMRCQRFSVIYFRGLIARMKKAALGGLQDQDVAAAL